MPGMRLVSVVVAASVLATGCASSSYKVPGYELARLAQQPPETRTQHVRVQQELGDDDVGPAQPVTAETQVVIFPQINVYGPYERRRYYQTNSTWGGGGGGGIRGGGGAPRGGGGASSLKLNGGGDGK